MSFKQFTEGLAVALISGATTTSAAYLSDPANITGVALGKRIGIVGGIGALTGLAAWLRASPLTPPKP